MAFNTWHGRIRTCPAVAVAQCFATYIMHIADTRSHQHRFLLLFLTGRRLPILTTKIILPRISISPEIATGFFSPIGLKRNELPDAREGHRAGVR